MRTVVWNRVTLWVAIAMLGAACSGEPIAVDVPRDAGPKDGGVLDAGHRDGGAGPVCGDRVCDRDAGEVFVNCPSDCPPVEDYPGMEGYACQSSFVAGDATFAQDDCLDADNLCIPWDDLSGRDDVFLPMQSCVKTCTQDSDCGMTDDGDPRACVAMPLLGTSAQIGKMCVDRIAQRDEYCGFSVNESVVITTPNARVKTGYDQVGCRPDATCVLNVVPTLNPDEGVCLTFCGRAGDDPCPSAAPYCNPGALEVGTSTVGVCSVAPLGLGSLCRPFEDDDRAGLTALCDRAAAAPLSCLALEGIEAGVCVEHCRVDAPCRSTDPDQPIECFVVDAATGDGVCGHANVGAFPDTCDGEGAFGRGRLPLTSTVGVDRVAVTWCTDRLRFALAPGSLDTNGVLSRGDDCLDKSLDAYRCPEPTTCQPIDADTSNCLVGCPLADGPDYCLDTMTALGLPSMNAQCVMTTSSTVVGYCGGAL